MTTMRALVARPSAPQGVELAEVEAPSPAADHALVEVRAVSLNRGEARYLPNREEGTVTAGTWPAWCARPPPTAAGRSREHAWSGWWTRAPGPS